MTMLLIDLSSIGKTGLYEGKDAEFGREVEHEGKKVYVNGWQHGYERFVGYVTHIMSQYAVQPYQVIMVTDGLSSTARRKAIYPLYKGTRGTKPEIANVQFNLLKENLIRDFRAIGCHSVTQDGCEADDILAFLAQNLEGNILVLSNDGDMATLINDRVSLIKGGTLLTTNPLGPFEIRHIPLYKALVGDASDNIRGAMGFGKKAWLDFLVWGGEQGPAALEGMVKRKTLHELVDDVAEFKPLRTIIDSAADVYAAFEVAQLHPEWCNTLRQPLQWSAGMVRGRDVVTDERLRPYAFSSRIVTKSNYESALQFIKAKAWETPYFCLDLETTVPEESDDWLAQRSDKGGGVDVIASTIVGCGLGFGANHQYGFYVSVDHKDTDNVSLDQLRVLLEAIPNTKITVAQNAAGFELPVMYQAFGKAWKDNGWRGMFPNMVDSRIAASYFDENQFSHGLKQMSKLLLGYEQTSYAEVTRKVREDGTTYQVKMDALTAAETVGYGLDDISTTVGVFNFYALIMELEKTQDAFYRIEQKPMYLSALSFVQGTPIDFQKLFELKKQDEATFKVCENTLNEYLVQQGWEGTVCPSFTELDAKAVKTAVRVILGQELETMVRTVAKMATLIDLLEHEDAPLLSQYVAGGNVAQINDWMASRFDGTPNLNVGSNKQLVHLLYETMGLPIRLRNRPTDTMREKGIREGNPRADEDAMVMAIKMGDTSPETAPVLQALTTMKSINTRSSLYWTAYPRQMHWKTGLIHPEVKQCGTNTRRHASSNPNIQQAESDPTGERSTVRSTILPHHKDAVIVSLDLAGQEIRLMADMSRDENMMSAYMGENPRDLHSFTAAMILGIPYDEFRARYKSEDETIAAQANEARQTGKTTFFASAYGAMAPKIAEGLGIEQSLAQSYLDALDRAFPGVGKWKKETENTAAKQGWVPIMGGNRRHLRAAILSHNNYEASKALRQASNARIQAAGGNQIRTVMTRIWDSNLLDDYDMRYYWPLHDENIVSVARKDAVAVIQRLHGFMCEQFLDVMPSASSIGIGRNYGDLIEIGEVADAQLIEDAVARCFAPVKDAETV